MNIFAIGFRHRDREEWRGTKQAGSNPEINKSLDCFEPRSRDDGHSRQPHHPVKKIPLNR
jgi:hypothetical protein